MANPKVGVISGRHPLPVHMYLVSREVTPGTDAYDAAYWAALRHGNEVGVGKTVDLFYTGLTELTLGAIDGYNAAFVNVETYRYDNASGDYVLLARKREEWKHCNHCGGTSQVPPDRPWCPACNQSYVGGGVYHSR